MKSSIKVSKDSPTKNAFGKCLIALSMLCAGPATGAEYRPHEVLIKFRGDSVRSFETMDRIYKSVSVMRVKRFRGDAAGLEQLILPDHASVEASVLALKSQPEIEYAQPNYILKALPMTSAVTSAAPAGLPTNILTMPTYPCLLPNVAFPPGCVDEYVDDPIGTPPGTRPALRARPVEVSPAQTDPQLSTAYGLYKTKANEAWGVHAGNSSFVVAVIDTGIDYNHRDLAFNLWRNPNPGPQGDVVGFDFTHNDGLPFDDSRDEDGAILGHGTHCAGVIGATGNNGIGISGVNQRVSIMALKFLESDGSGSMSNAVRAIDYAIGHGVKVISASWGIGVAPSRIPALTEAVGRARAHGILFVAAAGNEEEDNDQIPHTPANIQERNVISVAASTAADEIPRFSNYGAHTVHIAAPGKDVYSTVPGSAYHNMTGTSMAAPHVAGAAALVWSRYPNLTAEQVKARLLSTVDAIPSMQGKLVSGGRLNVLRALTETNTPVGSL